MVWKDPTTSQWRAFRDACPHRLVPLSEGRIDAATGNLECPYHGWQFDQAGACTAMPEGGNPRTARACATVYPAAMKQGASRRQCMYPCVSVSTPTVYPAAMKQGACATVYPAAMKQGACATVYPAAMKQGAPRRQCMYPCVSRGSGATDLQRPNKLRIGTGWDFRWGMSSRPPIPLYRTVAHTQGYMYDAKVWDSSIVQGQFSVAPCQPLSVRFAGILFVKPTPLKRRKDCTLATPDGDVVIDLYADVDTSDIPLVPELEVVQSH